MLEFHLKFIEVCDVFKTTHKTQVYLCFGPVTVEKKFQQEDLRYVLVTTVMNHCTIVELERLRLMTLSFGDRQLIVSVISSY